jgi:hypothetical protein
MKTHLNFKVKCAPPNIFSVEFVILAVRYLAMVHCSCGKPFSRYMRDKGHKGETEKAIDEFALTPQRLKAQRNG